MGNIIYIHYGSTSFNPEQNFPIKNERCWMKPKGGLWASRKNASWGWKDWCKAEEFRDCVETEAFEFVLRDGANVANINTLEQLHNLPEMPKNQFSSLSYNIDFEECLRRGYDAIELCWYGEEFHRNRKDDLHFNLYGWDCDSIVILNPNVVVPINKRHS